MYDLGMVGKINTNCSMKKALYGREADAQCTVDPT